MEFGSIAEVVLDGQIRSHICDYDETFAVEARFGPQ